MSSHFSFLLKEQVQSKAESGQPKSRSSPSSSFFSAGVTLGTAETTSKGRTVDEDGPQSLGCYCSLFVMGIAPVSNID